MKNKRGFYVFCTMMVALVVICVWALVSNQSSEIAENNSESDDPLVVVADVPPARLSLENEFRPSAVKTDKMGTFDEALIVESLENGAVPTQDVGEKGSLDGALPTNYPMVFAETKYERLPDSPLIIFEDDMIWRDGADGFRAKKDALADQAKHIQEASIALSVSPRVEMGKTTGYRLVEIPEKTLFSKMGMVSGDIIVSINGTMPDMEPMALMFVNMAAGKQGASTIVVDHRGVERTIHLRAAE